MLAQRGAENFPMILVFIYVFIVASCTLVTFLALTYLQLEAMAIKETSKEQIDSRTLTQMIVLNVVVSYTSCFTLK